jgi:hypothetical protein
MMALRSTSIFKALLALAACVLATSALAETVPTPTPDPAAWIAQNTDLAPAQVAISAPDLVYSVEPVGSRAPTGEALALVRTEALSAAWGEAHGFKSWDAHVLFDCDRQRMRIVRSAAYPELNRRGSPKIEEAKGEWIFPKADEPGSKLLTAACDAAFPWPLRTPALQQTVAEAEPPAPIAKAAGSYSVQVAYGPVVAGAERALARARSILGSSGAGLAGSTEISPPGVPLRYTALLSGFPDVDAAAAACKRIEAAKLPCATRRTPQALMAGAKDIAAESGPPATAAKTGPYVIQVAYGPSREGAAKALARARRDLGDMAGGLSATTFSARIGDKTRYTALLAGFTEPEAAAACKLLQDRGQLCLVRNAARSATSPNS